MIPWYIAGPLLFLCGWGLATFYQRMDRRTTYERERDALVLKQRQAMQLSKGTLEWLNEMMGVK